MLTEHTICNFYLTENHNSFNLQIASHTFFVYTNLSST